MWELVTVDKLDRRLVEDLFDNRVAAVRVSGFVDEAVRELAVAGVIRHGLEYYRDVDPPIGKIGITQFEHREHDRSRAEYFAAAPGATAQRTRVFAGSVDPVQAVVDAMGRDWPAPVGVATEPDGAAYFAGLVRVIGEGLIHSDWAGRDAPDWAIGAVDAQITWNLYLQVPPEGGTTVVYDHFWDPSAEEHLIPGSYGYGEALVDSCRSLRIEPANGDLVFFNSRNFHRIEASSGIERISVSSFMGRMPQGDLVLWS